MKNWTLVLAIGTAVATTAIGVEANSASAVTITEVKVTSIDILGNLFVQPGQTTKVSVRGQGYFSWENAQVSETVTIDQILAVAKPGFFQYTNPVTETPLPTQSGTWTVPAVGAFFLGKGVYMATYTLSVNPSDSISSTFEVKEIPEPLTILGTGVVLGAIPVLKKEYAKRKKKKDEDA